MANGIQSHKTFQRTFHIVENIQEQMRKMVENQLRGAALKLVHGFFKEEVERMSGPAFSRKNDERYYRGGSDPGSVILKGQRVKVRKPRLKRNGEEQSLQSYNALQGFDLLCDRVMKHMLAGVSTRNYDPLLDELEGGMGLPKSSVSRAFVEGSKQALEKINGRDLSKHEFFCIMIDGIDFGNRTVIVALGIQTNGKKLILGLREGNTENSSVCKDLLESLKERGLNCDEPYLFVIDGSKALRSAIKKSFGDFHPIQRCIHHKQRNVLQYLPKQYHAEFMRKWKKLHGCVDYDVATREYDQLHYWLSQINYQALCSLEEADRETLTVIRLKTPSMLRKTIQSTNPIESAFSVAETKTRNVKNWKSSPDQVSRWAATAILQAEKQFRTIRGYKQIPIIVGELKKLKKELENHQEVA